MIALMTAPSGCHAALVPRAARADRGAREHRVTRTVRPPPITSSSSAPDSPVCRRPAPARRGSCGSPSSSATPIPGGRAGRCDLGGYRLDTGPTVLTMPDLVDEALAAVGEKLGDRLDLVALAPRLPRPLRRRQPRSTCTPTPSAMEAEIRERVAGRRRRRATGGCGPGSTELYRVQMRPFIDANFDSPLDVLRPRPGPAGRAGRLRPARPADRPTFLRRRAAAADLLLPGALRGRPPGQGPRRLRGDRLHGHRSPASTFPAGGVHGRCRRPGRRRRRRGRRVPATDTTSPGWSASAAGSPLLTARRAPTADGDRIPADAVVLTPDLPVGPPAARARPAARGAAALLALGRCPARRAGPRRPGARPPHDLLRRRLGAHLRRDHPPGAAHDRPVAAGHPPDRHRPGARPAGSRATSTVLAPCPNTCAARPTLRLGPDRARATATSCSRCWRGRGHRPGLGVRRRGASR